MKTKFILGSLVLAATFVGCSNDELENVAVENNQSGLVELSENFMIGAVDGGVESRTHWELNATGTALNNVFAPVIDALGNNTFGATSVEAPTIGLCWLGQVPGAEVYTNYEFIHNGWLAKDIAEADFDECDDAVLLNGWLYSELDTELTDGEVCGEDVNVTPKTYGNKTLSVINFNSGVFKTENKSIFGGKYIAYYPYNPNFIEAGAIPATSAVEFNDVKKADLESMAIAENTFRYTNVATIEGGAKAEGFGFNNLSGVVRISLQNGTTGSDTDVEKILLYSPSSSFKKEVKLNASAIAAGKKGTQLYAETVETSKTILINMAEGESVNIVANNKNADIEDNAVYITMLPTTISDLKVLAYDADNGKWAECAISGNVEIPAGGSKGITVTYKDADFKSVYYAVDEVTLRSAIEKASAAGTENNPAVVKVLGDIEMKYNGGSSDVDNITVIGHVVVEGDDIIVSEGNVFIAGQNSMIKSNLFVKGLECCSDVIVPGNLIVDQGAIIDGDVETLKSERSGKIMDVLNASDLHGQISVATKTNYSEPAAVFTKNSKVTVSKKINFLGKADIYGELVIKEGATALVENDGVKYEADVNVKGGIVENNGTFEVKGNFAMLDAEGATVAVAGENFENNGKFIDNVGAIVGGATQYMINNGDYICKVHEQVRLDEAYENKLACNIIEFVNESGTDYDFTSVAKHNGKDVDLVVNAVVGFATTVDATLGNVTVNAGKSLFIHKSKLVADSKTNWAEININGNLNNSGAITVREDVRNMTAKNFTTNAGGSVVFENRVAHSGKTMTVSGAIEVKKNGSFTITGKTATKNVALVTCTKLIEGGTFSGKPNVVK